MSRPRVDVTFADACGLLEDALSAGTRRAILDAAQSTRGFAAALSRLRAAMQSHSFPTSASRTALDRVVRQLDSRTRAEGFHVLQSWDYRAHRFVDDQTAILMLDRLANAGVPANDEQASHTLAMLLDHYFLCVLSLFTVRAWDEGDASENLERVTQLLALLNGSEGSGHRFIERSELLLLLAISQYHPKEDAYDLLLSRVHALDERRRGHLALACAASLGSHLRWGFRFMYQRDPGKMRDDNVVDYPWLLTSIDILLDAYCRSRDGERCALERDAVVQGLVNGLTADPRAFVGEAPSSLAAHGASHGRVRACLAARRSELLEELERHRPDVKTYSPLGFECNFLNNAIVAMVATAPLVSPVHPSLDALLTRQPEDASAAAMSYARRLTRYAGETAGQVGGPALVIYDPHDGSIFFDAAIRALSGV